MNGKILTSKPLYVALAQRKDVRRMQLEAQFNQRNKGIPVPGGRGIGMPQPMYNGAPMFYAQPGPGQPGPFFVGQPGMVAARGRFPGGPGPYQAIPPNYLVMNAQGGRGQPPMKNAGMNRGGHQGPRGRGMKQHNQHQQAQPAPQIIEPVVAIGGATGPISTEEQKRLLGEKLYPMIQKTQGDLAGKITGMILESSYVEEILALIETPSALDEKVEEALKVLKEHNEKQQ